MNHSLVMSAVVVTTLAASFALGACGSGGNVILPAGADASSDMTPGPVDGGGGNDSVVTRISDTRLDFGASDCGGDAPLDKTITLTNAGGGTVTWSAQLDATPYFSLVGATSGSFSVGGAATLTVHAKPIPATAIAGADYRGTLLLTTNDPRTPSAFVPLMISAQGGTLSLSPSTASFGQVPINTASRDIALTLTNTGNKPVELGFAQPSNTDFTIAWAVSPLPVMLLPNASVAALAAHFTPTSILNAVTASAVTVKGAVCGATVSTIPMAGQGSGGLAVVSPGVIDFGLVDCGARALDKSVTILNTGNSAFTWTATFGKGAASPYAIAQASGTSTANSSTQVPVSSSNIPQTSPITANLYGETLTITTSAAGDAPHVVQLNQTARGAIIKASVASLNFGGQPIGVTSAGKDVTLTNNGNVNATVTSTSGDAVYAVTPSGATALAAGGGSVNVTTVFTPTSCTTANSQVSVSTPAVLCAPLPPSVSLTGTCADSCKAIKAGFPGSADGVYTLSGAGVAPFQAYCDMTNDGGGWTLAIKADGTNLTFGFTSALWTNTALLNPDKPAFDTTEAKLQAFNVIPFTQIRAAITDAGVTRAVVLSKAATSLAALFGGPYSATTLGRNAWEGVMASGSLQLNCNLEGINANAGGSNTQVRIGIVGNEQNDCSSTDSWIGIGGQANTCGAPSATTSVGDVACSQPDHGDRNVAGFGYVMVR